MAKKEIVEESVAEEKPKETTVEFLSSLAAVGRTMVASSGGLLADRLGWVPFFLLTTVATIPALLLLLWIARRDREIVT